jgi:transporter family-2 protein
VVRGIAPYFALAGLLAIPLLVGAGFLGPQLGIGLYLSSVVAGQLICSVALDHVGAFGIAVRHVDAGKILGVAALLVGVLLIRGVR